MDVSLYAKAGGQCFPGQLGTGSNRRAGQCVAQTEAVLESTRSPLPLHWTGRSRTNEACLLRMIVLGTREQRVQISLGQHPDEHLSTSLYGRC